MSLLKHAPQFDADEASQIALMHYGISGVATSLPSERDQNFLITTEGGPQVVLKITNSIETQGLHEALNDALLHLESRVDFCPRLVRTLKRKVMFDVRGSSNQIHRVRMVTYLPGQPLAIAPRTSKLMFDFGVKLGELSQALEGFDAGDLHRGRRFHWDLYNGMRVISRYLKLVQDETLRPAIHSFALNFDHVTALHLPLKVIHGDANDYNVLVQGDAVVGLIDFGDMHFSYAIGELAVAIAYVILDQPEPLQIAKHVVDGYLSKSSLTQEELEILWEMVILRLCMSVCLAAFQRKQNPTNEYLDISQQAIRNTLPKLFAIDKRIASNTFKKT
jgi:Ser/Thr protein kinase RdoA (MazF antagonist)